MCSRMYRFTDYRYSCREPTVYSRLNHGPEMRVLVFVGLFKNSLDYLLLFNVAVCQLLSLPGQGQEVNDEEPV